MEKHQDVAGTFTAPYDGFCFLASGVGDNSRPTWAVDGHSFIGGYSTGSYLNMSETICFPVFKGQTVESKTNQFASRALAYFIPFARHNTYTGCIKY